MRELAYELRLESMEKAIQDEYTESAYHLATIRECALITSVEDLEGLKVSHDFDGLDEGEARILTLKDSRILDNEGTSSFCGP